MIFSCKNLILLFSIFLYFYFFGISLIAQNIKENLRNPPLTRVKTTSSTEGGIAEVLS